MQKKRVWSSDYINAISVFPVTITAIGKYKTCYSQYMSDTKICNILSDPTYF